jgi:hypothetical protein
MQNIFSVGGDVLIDSEATVVTSSILEPARLVSWTRYLEGAHMGRVCVCTFIWVNVCVYMLGSTFVLCFAK